MAEIFQNWCKTSTHRFKKLFNSKQDRPPQNTCQDSLETKFSKLKTEKIQKARKTVPYLQSENNLNDNRLLIRNWEAKRK